MKLLRTLRLDPSDGFVFAHAAEPGEWAVPGGFVFADADLAALPPKDRAAFRSGFLGLASFGWSTLAVVQEASTADRAAALAQLTYALVTRLGAPDLDAARDAAEEEIAFAAALCDHAPGTLIALHREWDPETGVRERFRTLRRRESHPGADPLHRFARAFEIVEVSEDDPSDPPLDLARLLEQGGRP